MIVYANTCVGHRVVGSCRPCGEGVYGIVDHHGHTHLAYALEIPELPGQVQYELNIEKEGSLILSIKNPERPSPRFGGIPLKSKAQYEKDLQDKFLGRSFIPANPPNLLDYQGAEILLIGASDNLQQDLSETGKGGYHL